MLDLFMKGRFPVERWDLEVGTVRDSRGPERVVTNQPDLEFKHRPIGFRPCGWEPEEGNDNPVPTGPEGRVIGRRQKGKGSKRKPWHRLRNHLDEARRQRDKARDAPGRPGAPDAHPDSTTTRKAE